MAYCEEDDLTPYVEVSPTVAAFLSELTKQYPQIDDVMEEKLDECPWSISFDISEGHVIMPMVWSQADKMLPIIAKLAEKHALVCIDHQFEVIVTAPLGTKL